MDTITMGSAISIPITYTEYMTMLYPDYISMRDEVHYRYQKLVEKIPDRQ